MKHFQLFKPIHSSQRYFLFTDGSTRKESTPPVVGLGAELRDKNGDLIFTYSEELIIANLPTHLSPDESEKISLIQALKICLNENIINIVINTDSSGLSSKLNSFLETRLLKQNEYQNFLTNSSDINKEIFQLADQFNEIFIEYIPRELNKHADFYSRSTGLLLKNYALLHYTNSSPLNIHQYSKNQKKLIHELDDKLEEQPNISPKEFEKIKTFNNISFTKEAKKLSKPKSCLSSILRSLSNTSSSFVISNMANFHKHYKDRNEEKILNIDIQEHKSNINIRFFYGLPPNSNPYEFKNICINKEGDNIYMQLLFILYNLITESSDINLKKPFNSLDKFYYFDYSPSVWSSIDLTQKTYLKSRVFIQKNTLANFKNFFMNLSHQQKYLGQYFSFFADAIMNTQNKVVLHHTHNNQELYLDDEAIAAANAASIALNIKKGLQLS